MAHPMEQKLRDLYAAFGQGDLGTVLGMCTDDITFTVPGKSRVGGTYSKAEFGPGLVGTVMQLSGGTFREEIVDVFANDDHGIVLLDHSFQRDGTPRAYRTAHIWQIRDGQFSRWEEWPGDLGIFDEAWGA